MAMEDADSFTKRYLGLQSKQLLGVETVQQVQSTDAGLETVRGHP